MCLLFHYSHNLKIIDDCAVWRYFFSTFLAIGSLPWQVNLTLGTDRQ